MSYAETFVKPQSLKEFKDTFISKKILFSKPMQIPLPGVNPWPFLNNLLEVHANSWLALRGKLPDDPNLNCGRISPAQARKGFETGHTILLKQAQKSNGLLNLISKDFELAFGGPVDLQVYFTPTGNEGFDWHYDAEDVFIIQVAGYKEFRLIKNTVNPNPDYQNMPKDLMFYKENASEETRCLLAPSDILYIPAGYWHKAYAHQNSLHFSVGVLCSSRFKTPAVSV